jgi:uncharacterized protein DUF4389
MSDVMTAAAAEAAHPIRLVVNDDLKRNRLTVFFRLLLAIPHLIVVALWGIVAFVAVVVAWFVALFTGRVPDGLHAFLAQFVRYATRVNAYVFLIADPFPPFGAAGSYPVELHVGPPTEQGRLGVAFRIILAIPALILANILSQLLQVIAFIGWFYALFTGRMSQGMRDLAAFCLRYEMQTYGYVLLLTNRYPSLSSPAIAP